MKTGNNRKCIVCGKEYHYCPSCSSINDPSWKSLYHDANCKDIFHIVSWYLSGDIKKEKALKDLEKCDLSKKYMFKNDIRAAIDEIFASKAIAQKNDEIKVSNKNMKIKKELLQNEKVQSNADL